MTASAGTILCVVDAILTGRATDFARGERSAIGKRPVDRPVRVAELGIDEDEQGDPVFHGGPNKAVHHYARDHYPTWRAEVGDLPVLDSPGAFGENLSTTGITEHDVCLGDRIRVGTAVLRVSQGRRPCWKLNHRFGVPDMARRVLTTGRTGWYYAVDQEGIMAGGDGMVLVERPHPEWPLSRLVTLILHRGSSVTDLREALVLPLPDSWRDTLERRLRIGSSEGEDWME